MSSRCTHPQEGPNFGTQVMPSRFGGSWQDANHHVTKRLRQDFPRYLTKLTFHPIACGSISHRLGRDEPKATRFGRTTVPGLNQAFFARRCVTDNIGARLATSTTTHPSEVTRVSEAVCPVEHARYYAESSMRPLRRRAPKMARPARVRMRRRKPCTLARRRLLGWNVRLLISQSPGEQMSRAHSEAQNNGMHTWHQPIKSKG
jgi:hypothetical protein